MQGPRHSVACLPLLLFSSSHRILTCLLCLSQTEFSWSVNEPCYFYAYGFGPAFRFSLEWPLTPDLFGEFLLNAQASVQLVPSPTFWGLFQPSLSILCFPSWSYVLYFTLTPCKHDMIIISKQYSKYLCTCLSSLLSHMFIEGRGCI